MLFLCMPTVDSRLLSRSQQLAYVLRTCGPPEAGYSIQHTASCSDQASKQHVEQLTRALVC